MNSDSSVHTWDLPRKARNTVLKTIVILGTLTIVVVLIVLALLAHFLIW